MDAFLLGAFDDFCTRNDAEPFPARAGDAGAGDGAFGAGEASADDPSLDAPGLDVPQRQVCFRGIAAVTLAHPHCRDGGCGHRLRGRPGFRTGTMRRSLAWLHLVERCPRIHGSLRVRGQRLGSPRNDAVQLYRGRDDACETESRSRGGWG